MPVFAPRGPQRHAAGPKAAVLARPAGRRAAAGPNFSADNPHSRRVALLKRVLPAIGLVLLLLIAVWPRLSPLWERLRSVFPAIDLREARQLRMVNPRYVGVDRLGRPFVVTSAAGRQVPDRQDLMSLEGPRADMTMHSGANVVVTAATGVYQSQAQLLDLFGAVTLVHQDGTQFVTDKARVDVANNAAEGDDPVEGHGPSGDVKAQGFRISDKGDTIIFAGKTDMLLAHARPGSEKSPPPPRLPAAVAAAAARTAAEAKPALAAAAAQSPAKPAARADDIPRPHPQPPPGKPTGGKKT